MEKNKTFQNRNVTQGKTKHRNKADKITAVGLHKKTVEESEDEEEPDLEFSIDMPETTIRPGKSVAAL